MAMPKMIRLPAHDGKYFNAYIAEPSGGRFPVIIVIQEIFGVNAVMRSVCDDLAGQGYVAVCPDLFWRQEPNVQLTDKTEAEWAKAFELYKGFNEKLGIADLKSTLAYMRTYAAATNKVGTIGFCLGGKLAYLMAAASDVDCGVSYYGVGIETALHEIPAIKRPLLLHVAEEDKFVTREAQEKIKEAVTTNPYCSVITYPGCNHAFARRGGEHWNKDAHDRAAAATTNFFKRYLNT